MDLLTTSHQSISKTGPLVQHIKWRDATKWIFAYLSYQTSDKKNDKTPVNLVNVCDLVPPLAQLWFWITVPSRESMGFLWTPLMSLTRIKQSRLFPSAYPTNCCQDLHAPCCPSQHSKGFAA